MELQFLLVGVVAIGLLTAAPDSDAHSGGGGGHGGAMFQVGGILGAFAAPKEVFYEPKPVSFFRFSSYDVATASRRENR